ncbi:MAG: hypothetical protein KDA51_04745, partial [Planctomycetales bacterium]|nr:hypothetical protein [Planctomycetales bacterium]
TIADHPNDTVAQFHVAHSPLGDYYDWTPAQVGSRAQAASLALRIRRELLQEGYGACVSAWGDALRSKCTRREWDRIQQLIETAFRYERRATLRPMDFVHLVQEQTVLDPSSAPIRVMTVHQSKGLEFDAVIFCELEGQLSPRPGGFVVAHDPRTLEATHVVRYANKHVQALMPQRIQKVFDQALCRDIGESLCVLYVALTRAKHALYLITTPRLPSASASAKKAATVKHRKRYSGLLHAALVGNDPLVPEQIVYECGDPKWYDRIPGPHATPATAIDRPRIKPIRFASPQRGGIETLETVAPSSLEGGGRLKLEELPDAQREFAFAYGTVIHAWFEQIEWLETSAPTDQQLIEIAKRYHDFPADQVAEAIERFRWMLQQSATSQLLTRSAYIQAAAKQYPAPLAKQLVSPQVAWEVHHEARIASPDEDWLLVGNVDRLVVASSAQQVIAAEV